MPCSTCNHKTFVKDVKEVRGVMTEFLRNENRLIDINCDMRGENFKIGAFTIYRCPTCGRKLF